jgi:hypothetical protein
MSVEIGKTYTMRMGYGEEIVAKITAYDSSTLTLSKPVAVVPGQQGIQLMNSLFTADPEADVTVNRSSVAMIAPVREDVGDSYLEATTGIKPVRSKILMG